MKKMDSNVEWKKWGEIDPLFGVASWDNRERSGSNPWSDQEFYQLGELDWKDFSAHWENYGLNRESCLEIGCGAGRITTQLALNFSQVYAIDVSDKMIEYAKKQIANKPVIFHVTSGVNIPLGDQSVYSVFSTHVFQHFDSLFFANKYFLEISRIMKVGGTFMIHLPVYIWPSKSGIFDLIYMLQKASGNVRAVVKRTLMQYGATKPLMRRFSYPIDYFYDVLPKYGFGDIEVAVFVVNSNNAPHPFVFARKKA